MATILKGAQNVDTQIVEAVATAAGAGQAKAASSIFGFKLFNFVAWVLSGAIFLMVFLVMAMTRPATYRETIAALLSTCVSCIGVGGFIIIRFGMIQAAAASTSDYELFTHIVVIASIVFAAGAPGWVLTRSVFLWIDKSKNKTFVELWKELKGAIFK